MAGGLSVAHSQSPVDQRLEDAYVAVREVSESHGDAGHLVDLINQALAEYEAGADPGDVVARLDEVVALAAEEKASSIAERDTALLVTGAQLALVGVLVYASWRYLPGVFWRRWLRVRGGWLVEHAGR